MDFIIDFVLIIITIVNSNAIKVINYELDYSTFVRILLLKKSFLQVNSIINFITNYSYFAFISMLTFLHILIISFIYFY